MAEALQPASMLTPKQSSELVSETASGEVGPSHDAGHTFRLGSDLKQLTGLVRAGCSLDQYGSGDSEVWQPAIEIALTVLTC